MWHVTHDMWHVRCDTWNVTHGGGWTFSQNCSSLALTVWVWRHFKDFQEKDQWMMKVLVEHLWLYRVYSQCPSLSHSVKHTQTAMGGSRRRLGCWMQNFHFNFQLDYYYFSKTFNLSVVEILTNFIVTAFWFPHIKSLLKSLLFFLKHCQIEIQKKSILSWFKRQDKWVFQYQTRNCHGMQYQNLAQKVGWFFTLHF